MRTTGFVVTIILILMVIAFIINRRFIRSTRISPVEENLSFERKIEILADCGLKLAEPFRPEDLLGSWDREEYEKPGFSTILVALGMTEEQEPWRNRCVNLWHFDTECIEGDGSYKRIADRMAEMTQGALILEDIEDHVDLEQETAYLSFIFKGQRIRFDCKVDDDWVDPDVFPKFIELLKNADSSKIYIFYDLGGQDCIIGCVSKDEMKELLNNGIKVTPLS